jgi:hypothetical protein
MVNGEWIERPPGRRSSKQIFVVNEDFISTRGDADNHCNNGYMTCQKA